jgi:hypothetical protein
VDDLIDVIEGNRKYIKCVYVYNKIDVVGIDDVDNLARQPNSLVISCNLKVCFICVFRQFDPIFVCVIPKNYIVILAALNCSTHHQVL